MLLASSLFVLFTMLFYCSSNKNDSPGPLEDVAAQLLQNTPQEVVLETRGTINAETGELVEVNSVSVNNLLLSSDDLATYHGHASVFDTYHIQVDHDALYLKFSLSLTEYENVQAHLRERLASFLAELQRQEITVLHAVNFTVKIKVRSHELNLHDEDSNPVSGFIGIYNTLKDKPEIEQQFITQSGSQKPEYLLSFEHSGIITAPTNLTSILGEAPFVMRAILRKVETPEGTELRGSSVFKCHYHWFGAHSSCQVHKGSCGGENETCYAVVPRCSECRCWPPAVRCGE